MMTAPSMLLGTLHDPSQLAPSVAEVWRGLLFEQVRPAAFLGPTFAHAIAKARSGTRVCVLEHDRHPVGFFAFQFTDGWRHALGSAERIGGEMSDYAGLVASSDVRLEPEALLRLAGLQSFTFSHLPESQQQFGLSGSEPRIGLRIEFPQGPTEYWKQRRKTDASLVRDTERRRRKLEQDVGPVRFVFQATDGTAELDQLIAAKRKQYARTGTADSLSQPWNHAVLRALLATSREDCTGVLSTLHAGETWVARHFGLRCGNTLHYWFPVYNPEMAKYSPGRLLLVEIINASEETGLRLIDRGEGDTAAKRDFATAEHIYLRGRWNRSGLRAILSNGTDSIRWRLVRGPA